MSTASGTSRSFLRRGAKVCCSSTSALGARRSERQLPADFVEKLTFAIAEVAARNSARAPSWSGFACLLRCRKDLGQFAEVSAVAARRNSSFAPHGPRNRRHPSPRIRLRCASLAKSAPVFRHDLAQEARDGLHPAGGRQIGLRHEPDWLVDAQVGVETNQFARLRQKMR